jgi:hypothetical protein
MKYLKLFESFNEENILDFCEGYLAYLLDDSTFKIGLIDNRYCSQTSESGIGGMSESYNSYVISLYREKNEIREGEISPPPMTFLWSDIKDYFIPFLTVLSKKYEILNITFVSHIVSYRDIKLDDIEDGVRFAIRSIMITIKK